ncbi:MAG TPA: hypothetical protein VHA79_01520 [Mycobacteriales bacterium]|nr:hypothetical protein [Mycobacteriales bacterium]
MTVTGHCYDPATGAATGDVAGSSSWSGSDTSIPDTTLPACPSGQGLGGVDVDGTGSASGVDVETTPDPTRYGAPKGTATGPITVDNPWLPADCQAEDADCYTAWQHSVNSHWVDVDAADVPDNYASDYRCELKTGAGVQVATMPVSACPSPAGETQTTGATGTGDPEDGDVHIDGSSAVSCTPHGWALFNPVDWVMKPVECALQWAFVPDSDWVSAQLQDLHDGFVGSSVGLLMTGFGDFISAFLPPSGDSDTSGNCQGPALSISALGLVDMHPLDACAEPMKTVAHYVRTLLQIGLWIGLALLMVKVGAGAFGMRVPMGGGDDD